MPRASLLGSKLTGRPRRCVAALARKCNEGRASTREERLEYETYVMAGEFIAILQAKARILLGRGDQRA